MAIDKQQLRFPKRLASLRRTARQLRTSLLRRHLVTQGESLGEKLSALDLLVYLGKHWLGRRDKLVISAGHGVVDLIGVLCESGLSLPRRRLVLTPPGEALETATRLARELPAPHRVACLLSSSECDGDTLNRSALAIARERLGNLTIIVDLAQYPPELGMEDESPTLVSQWDSLGFLAVDADGHNLPAIHEAISCRSSRPLCLVAKTLIGRDIAFAGDLPSWHYPTLRPEQYAMVMSGLEDRES